MWNDPVTGESNSIWPLAVAVIVLWMSIVAVRKLVRPKSPRNKIEALLIFGGVVLLIQTAVLWQGDQFIFGLLNALATVAVTSIVYCIIGGLVAFCIASVRAKSGNGQRPNYRRRVVYIALLISLLGEWGYNGQLAASKQPSAQADASQSPVASSIANVPQVSEQDQERFKAIIQGVMGDSSYMTPQIQAEFWMLIDKNHLSQVDVQNLKQSLPLTNLYGRAFWQDALSSFKTGQPIKSDQRRMYESRLTEAVSPDAAQQRITKDDAMIAKIAAHQLVDVQGTSVVVNESMIQSALSGADAVSARLDKLFTRPW